MDPVLRTKVQINRSGAYFPLHGIVGSGVDRHRKRVVAQVSACGISPRETRTSLGDSPTAVSRVLTGKPDDISGTASVVPFSVYDKFSAGTKSERFENCAGVRGAIRLTRLPTPDGGFMPTLGHEEV